MENTEQYLSLLFSQFDTGIPWAVIGITVLMASLGSCAIYYRHRRMTRRMVIPWIVACLFLMVYTAVLRRTSQPEYSIHLMPFWSIQAIQKGYIETLYEKIYNVIFFVPFGFLLGAYLKKYPIRNSIVIGCIISIGIELLQLITRTGTCETDDVICNTLGGGIGAVIGVSILEIYKRIASGNYE